MEWTSLNDLREKYLSFFESKGHLRLPSFSLVPDHDKSLLLINSGMAPMKKYFTGEINPPSKRVTTCQKCIRTPDIERVGKTARHGTYFEMLGNFSFGDYFKREACQWAWEFITQEMKMPVERVREILKISQEPVSLETPIGEEDDSNLGDFVADVNTVTPEGNVESVMLRDHIDALLGDLKERERQVIELRFGLRDGHPRTLEEVGKEFNVTRERIRQIEAKALRKLRNPVRSKRIRDFLA